MIRQGDIYWVALDESVGAAPGYLLPCVVVQSDLFNQSRILTVVVCALTSNLRRAEVPGNVLLEDGEAGLPGPRVVNVTQIITIDKRHLGDFIGRLAPGRVRQVLDGIGLVLDPRTAE